MPATTFQQSITTSAVAVSAFTHVVAVPVTRTNYGVCVTLDASASNAVYYGLTGVLTTTGTLIPAGVPVTIPNAFYGGDLTALFLIASSAQALTGYVL